MGWSRFVNMAMTDEEKIDSAMPVPIASADMPEYPYGLRICLTQAELEKLDLEDDCEVGDIIDLRAFARVTSCSANQMSDGSRSCRIELQIEQLAVDDENDEDPDDDG